MTPNNTPPTCDVSCPNNTKMTNKMLQLYCRKTSLKSKMYKRRFPNHIPPLFNSQLNVNQCTHGVPMLQRRPLHMADFFLDTAADTSWNEAAVLEQFARIPGISEKSAHVLYRSGFTSLEALASMPLRNFRAAQGALINVQ